MPSNISQLISFRLEEATLTCTAIGFSCPSIMLVSFAQRRAYLIDKFNNLRDTLLVSVLISATF